MLLQAIMASSYAKSDLIFKKHPTTAATAASAADSAAAPAAGSTTACSSDAAAPVPASAPPKERNKVKSASVHHGPKQEMLEGVHYSKIGEVNLNLTKAKLPAHTGPSALTPFVAPGVVQKWDLTPSVDATWMGCSNEHVLYERHTCAKILEMVQKRLHTWKDPATNPGIVIGYVSGIGKTMFLNRLLIHVYELFKTDSITQHKVLFFDRTADKFVLFDFITAKARLIEKGHAENMIENESLRSEIIVLEDPSCTKRRPNPRGPAYLCVMCGKASKRKAFAEAVKQAHMPIVTMDPLTLAEATIILGDLHDTPKKEVETAYTDWGGNLRHLRAFVTHDEDKMRQFISKRKTALLEIGLMNSTCKTARQLIGATSSNPSVSHFFLHEFREHPENCVGFQLVPTSLTMRDMIHKSLLQGGRHELANFLGQVSRHSPYYWWGFEDMMHHYLAHNATLVRREVLSKGPKLQDLPEKFFDRKYCGFPFKYNKGVCEALAMEWEHVTTFRKNSWPKLDLQAKYDLFQKGLKKGLAIDTEFKTLASMSLRLRQAKRCNIPKLSVVTVPQVSEIIAIVEQYKGRAVYYQPNQRFFPGVDSFAIAPAFRDSFGNSLILFQIYSGSDTKKTVKNVPKLRNIFEKLKILQKDEPLNFALVVPIHEIDTPVIINFEGENVEETCKICQWKVSTSVRLINFTLNPIPRPYLQVTAIDNEKTS